MFSQPEIKKLFEPYAVVQMYTDRVPNEFYSGELQSKFGKSLARQIDDAMTNNEFLKKKFGTIELPFYVILEPRKDGDKLDVVGTFQGLIRNQPDFAQFLRKPGGEMVGAVGPHAQAGK